MLVATVRLMASIICIAVLLGGWVHGGGGNFLLASANSALLDGSSVKLTAD